MQQMTLTLVGLHSSKPGPKRKKRKFFGWKSSIFSFHDFMLVFFLPPGFHQGKPGLKRWKHTTTAGEKSGVRTSDSPSLIEN